jgi:hypothetical protein
MGRTPLQEAPLPPLETEQIFRDIRLNNPADHTKHFAFQRERRLAAIRPQSIGENTGGEQLGIEQNKMRKVLTQVEPKIEIAIGSNDHPGSGIEKADPQGGFQIRTAVGTQQQHGPGLRNADANQSICMAHVANHKGVRQAGLLEALQPERPRLVKAAQGNLEAQECVQAGTPQLTETADHNQAGW